MSNIFDNYIQSISSKFAHKETSEMGYRSDFETLIRGVFESINVKRIDHDAKAAKGNKPDFIVLKNDIPILYLETKDIGVSLDKVEKSEQMARYYGYANLVLTDYVEFRFYRNGIKYQDPIKIADFDLKNRTIVSVPENYEHVAKTLLDFTKSHKEPIKSGKHLSQIMGGKAQRIRDNTRQFLATKLSENSELAKVYEMVKKLLVHDLTPDSFADMYAQTLVYGLFVARYHDDTPDNFTRQEARGLIPKSNPLLQHFFDHIVGPNFDERLKYIVNELCEVFSHADVPELMKEYLKGADPVIHFYEDFLEEYDDKLRKKMGAYYTPLPVVRFIVNSVDYLLKKEFGLTAGLADSSKTSSGVHRVQILDPAVGTGTFLTEILQIIYSKFTDQIGRWPAYVYQDLLPRLYGFELMMAPYTIAHLKMSMWLKEKGFKHFNSARLGIYLTNSLEDISQQPELLAFDFAASIAEEAKEASKIKNEKPIMVVVGNPPYSINSSNKSEWILNLIKDYKKDLHEQKINLDDDYIKFIRFAEHFIEKNKSGIVAMITNNSFIDGITHRQMRKHLLETFDEIYILDLHGNSKKKEKAPDGGKDENVFDIQQGVSISMCIRKTGEKKGLGTVHHAELYGKREDKFKALNESNINDIKWKKLDYSEPYYFFVPKDFELDEEYVNGFKITDLFNILNTGIQTKRDGVTIGFSEEEIKNTVSDFVTLDEAQIRTKYSLPADGRDWAIKWAKGDLLRGDYIITDILYRPFDIRKTAYTGRSKGFQAYPRETVSKHFVKHENIGLVSVRMYARVEQFVSLVTNTIIEKGSLPASNYSLFPLYVYANNGSRVPNFKKEIINEIEKIVGKTTPEDIFDYIYAVLHSPSYREKYKEFLKIDFPRVPYPKDEKSFKKLVVLGTELRLLHLLESPKVNKFITTYPIVGENIVEKPLYKDGKVFINKEQYFGDVPEVAWNFYIGGYQPAQKWLKDRKSRTLNNEDIEHYQKIIVALTETDRIMKEIDKIII